MLKKSAQRHYDCMTFYQICDLPVRELAAPDCWLLLWTSAPMLDFAMSAMCIWGFDYKTCLAWRKVTVSGKVRMGCGYIARMMIGLSARAIEIMVTKSCEKTHRKFPSGPIRELLADT
jgi:N6-adenosine-specific RNA methylase IME4